MKDRIRIGVVGSGDAGRRHLRAALQLGAAVEVAWVSDLDPEKAYEARRCLSIDCESLGHEQAVDAPADLVIVCTPPSTHKATSVLYLNRGRHVLVEKPLFVAADEPEILKSAALSAGKSVFAISQHRMSAASGRLRRIVRQCEFGQVLGGDVSIYRHRAASYYRDGWKGSRSMAGGGVLMSLAYHALDVLVASLGKPTEVAAISRLAADGDVEDMICGSLVFGRKQAFCLRAGVGPGESRLDEIRIMFEQATATWRPNGLWIDDIQVEASEPKEDLYRLQLEQVVEDIVERTSYSPCLQDVRPTLETISFLYSSAFTGRTQMVPQ